MRANRQSIRAALACVMAIGLSLTASPAVADNPTPIVESHTVDTSVATGTFSAPDFGVSRKDVTVGTYLSGELANTIVTTHPQFTDAAFQSGLAPFGTLTNYEFLTSNLTQFGNAGDQLISLYDQIVVDLRTAHPGYNLKVTKVVHSTGHQSYSLFGGILDDQGNILADPSGYTGQVTIVTGSGEVDFYQVDYTLTVTSTNSITIVKKTEGGDGTFSFTSSEPALNQTLTTSGGTASTGQILLPPGSYSVTEALGSGFALTDLSCDDPDGGTTTDLGSRTATIDLDEGEAIVCTFTDANASSRTEALIHNFLQHRLGGLLSEDPDRARLIRRLSGATGTGEAPSPFSLAGSLTGGHGGAPLGSMVFATSLRRMASALAYAPGSSSQALAAAESFGTAAPPRPMLNNGIDLWVEAHYRGYSDDVAGGGEHGELGLLYVGADYLVTPDLLVGILTQVDWSSESASTTNSALSGTGWMAGPYVSARLMPNLYLDVRAAWGTSDNRVSPLGTYTDSFTTTRWLTTARLTGDWRSGPWVFRPSATLKYGEEDQAAYTDSNGAAIAAQTVSTGQLTFGPEISYRQELANGVVVEPQVSLTGQWTFAGGNDVFGMNATPLTRDAFSGRIEAGVEVSLPTGASLRLSGAYDGIGASGFDAESAAFRLSVPIN